MTDVIAKEVALQEFDRFVDEMDLDVDESLMDSEDLTAFNKQKNRIIRVLQRGNLVINDSGEAVLTPSNKSSSTSDPITFHEATGASVMAMDGKKKNHDVSKTYAIMAGMCKVHPNVFSGLAGSDYKVAQAIFTLLMD